MGREGGAVPREPGTRMIVGARTLRGTIGGGHLEFEAIRIAREAIINAAHAETRRVVVSLRRVGSGFVLRIRDDGSGIEFPGRKRRSGFGLRSMRERAADLGGTLAVRQMTNGGTEREVVFR